LVKTITGQEEPPSAQHKNKGDLKMKKSILNAKVEASEPEEKPKPEQAMPETKPEQTMAEAKPTPVTTMLEPELSEEAKAVSKDVCSRMLAQLKPFTDKRDEAEVKLKRLEKGLSEYSAKRDALQTELSLIVTESTVAMMDGKDTSKATKDIGRIKAELSEVMSWVEEIGVMALPKARIAYDQAQNALDTFLATASAPVIAEYKQKLVDLMKQGVEISYGYLAGLDELRKLSRVTIASYETGKTDAGAEAMRLRKAELEKYIKDEKGVA
jgi:hypothetical protein